MKRILPIGVILLLMPACQVPGDRTALPPPLPDKITSMPYTQLVQRAHDQVVRANDLFFVNNWIELEYAARGIEQTAQYLAKAEDVPARHKDTLATTSADLGKLARALREAAVARDVKKTKDCMTKLRDKVYDMRPAD